MPARIATIIALAIWATPAFAEDCKPLRPVGVAPLENVEGGARVTVPVSVNGVAKHLLLDTVGGRSSLSRAAADALKLRTSYTPHKLLDAAGYASKKYVVLDTLQWGNLKVSHAALMVTPDPSFGQDAGVDGVFAADLMENFDVEMDFAAHRLIYFATDHCPGAVVHWQAPAIGVAPLFVKARSLDMVRNGPLMTKTVVDDPDFQQMLDSGDLSTVLGTDIRTTVTIDGKDFTANIDTGAENSTLNSEDAKAAWDVTADSPGSMPITRPAGESGTGVETVVVDGTRGFQHRFHTMTIGTVTVTNPQFTVLHDRTGRYDNDNQLVTGSHIVRTDDRVRPQVTIGMDILSKLHLYFAFKEGRLYVTDAGPSTAGM